MANYTVRLDNVTGPDVVSVGDGTTYATLSVNTNVSTPLISDPNPTLSADLDLNGNDITGTGDISITGSVTATTADINGGTIDGTVIGGSTPAAGSFTAVSATSGDLNLDTLDLNAIAASKAVTAVDVFVYDTSKDSDGGAWRKRTQGTSWYNETLNTATRGSRREFPAVAVIVAEASKITIYDGDDPSLPMFKVMNASANNPVFAAPSSIVALNATLAVGTSGGASVINFISDSAEKQTTGADQNYLAGLAVEGAGWA